MDLYIYQGEFNLINVSSHRSMHLFSFVCAVLFSLWETLAARKETDMRMCGIMELKVDRILVPFAILCIVVSIMSHKSASHC